MADPKAEKAQQRHWIAFPGKAPVCRDCGSDWQPVRRGECSQCGSDAAPIREDETARHPAPPGPPGPPMHDHPDGSRCMWVQRGGIDRHRQVDHIGTDLGPCPGFDQPRERDHFSDISYVECTCGHDYDGHDVDGCVPACGCRDAGPAPTPVAEKVHIADAAAPRPRPHHYMNADGTCHAGDLFEQGTECVVLYTAEELVRIVNSEKAEAWEQGHFYCAAEAGNDRRTNPYSPEPTEGERPMAATEGCIDAPHMHVDQCHQAGRAEVEAKYAALVAAVEAVVDEWEHPAEVYALRKSAAPRLRAVLAEFADPAEGGDR